MKVKICGITSIDDALTACDYGADAIGFVFYKKSPRYITPENAIKIVEKLPVFVSTVGVFVNESIQYINDVINSTGIDYVQLHGDEPIETVLKFGRKGIKAFRIKDALSIEEINKSGLNLVLLDSYSELYGGSGRNFDHTLLSRLSPDLKFILSGGINPDNVCSLIELYHPYGIDVSSGVEITPGKKSKEKIKLLFKRIENCKWKQ
jgi:phosphoribosylanthranilate isomerase